jgi:hypothetical protein
MKKKSSKKDGRGEEEKDPFVPTVPRNLLHRLNKLQPRTRALTPALTRTTRGTTFSTF